MGTIPSTTLGSLTDIREDPMYTSKSAPATASPDQPGDSIQRIVVALGGNALGETPQEQIANIEAAVPPIMEIIAQGHEVILTHGNGPQVGIVQDAFQIGHDTDSRIPTMPLPECVAATQGYIGYHLQECITDAMRARGMDRFCSTMVTAVEVDPKDPAFRNPVKPIGQFYTEDQAKKLMEAQPGVVYREDSGRGWRRCVPSPDPKRIVEAASILKLLDSRFTVIACGGGGIPVYRDEQGLLHGIDAVLDKDLGSAMLGIDCNADRLFLLTAVENVYLGFGTPDQKALTDLPVADAKRYLAQGQFGAGSMAPKVEAAVRFAESGPGRVAVIGALSRAPQIMGGTSGTRVHL